MKFRLTAILLLFTMFVSAQEEKKEKAFIPNDVRTWKMTNMFTHADTIPIDTATNLHQVNDPLYHQSLGWVTTGNIGAPAKALYYPDVFRHQGNIFLTPLLPYIEQPEDYVFYNTKTPYANFTYQKGFPKRRSEEYVHILFTQNVNRKVNFGAKLAVRSSIGRYEAQRIDHYDFRLHGSFNGEYYNGYGSVSYHKAKISENGGIMDEALIRDPNPEEKDMYKKPEDLPVNMMNAVNKTSLYRIFYTHSFDLAHVERLDIDSTVYEVPVMTAFHTFHLETSHREFKMSSLPKDTSMLNEIFPNELEDGQKFPFYDKARTADSTRYFSLKNIFQLKMTEEFNSLLRFGVRAFLETEINLYTYPDFPQTTEKETQYGDIEKTFHYRKKKSDFTDDLRMSIGGEISKHRGENLSFSAMAKCYFMGYREGDFVIDGHINTSFPFLKSTASVWGQCLAERRSPDFWEEKYISNLYQWDNDLNAEQSLNVRGGIRIGQLNTEVTGYFSQISDMIYFGPDGKPRNYSSNTGLQLMGVQLKTHLQGAGFNTITRCAVQHTSNENVVALPLFAVHSSNFFEHRFFDVLTFQLGIDLQYNTKYLAPLYNPATMQFCSQEIKEKKNEKGETIVVGRKFGNYVYFDPFVNIQIKRVRAYFKYSHVNSMWKWFEDSYFLTAGYPSNPQTMKFGISWNFYD